MDAMCIRIKKFADKKISGYVWTGSKACNVAKNNLSEVKHKTMLASGLRCNRMWAGLKAFSGSQYFYSAPLVVKSFCMRYLCLCLCQSIFAPSPPLPLDGCW